jgi:hypothetical protein
MCLVGFRCRAGAHVVCFCHGGLDGDGAGGVGVEEGVFMFCFSLNGFIFRAGVLMEVLLWVVVGLLVGSGVGSGGSADDGGSVAVVVGVLVVLFVTPRVMVVLVMMLA